MSNIYEILTNTPLREYNESDLECHDFEVEQYFGSFVLTSQGCLYHVKTKIDYLQGHKVQMGALIHAQTTREPNQYLVIFTAPDGRLYRSLATQEHISINELYEGSIYGPSYSPSSKVLTFANSDKEVIVASCDDGLSNFKFVKQPLLAEHPTSIQAVTFGPIMLLAILEEERLTLYLKGEEVAMVDGVVSMATVGHRFCYLRKDGTIYSWSCQGFELLDTVTTKEALGTTLLYEKCSHGYTLTGKGRYFTLDEYIKSLCCESASYIEIE